MAAALAPGSSGVSLSAPFARLRAGVRGVAGDRQAMVGISMVVIVVAIAVIGPAFAPFSPTQVGAGPPTQGASAAHWLGTDDLGRDVLSRFLTGGLALLVVPLAAVTVAFLVGGTAGLVCGYLGGRADLIFTRVIDILLPIPALLIALLLITAFGGSNLDLAIIVALVFLPRIGRIIRGAVQNITHMEYVEGAEARGEQRRTIIFKEILPNIAGPALVEYGIRINFAVAFVAGLNFLGLGAQPPSSNWGLMIADGQAYIFQNPLATLVPAIALAVVVVGINLVTDSASKRLSRELGAAAGR